LTITKDLTRVMSRIQSAVQFWACSTGTPRPSALPSGEPRAIRPNEVGQRPHAVRTMRKRDTRQMQGAATACVHFFTCPCAPTQSPFQSSSVGSTFKTSLARGLLATGSSLRIFPSRKTSTRLANCAMSCSWVTRTIVNPWSFKFSGRKPRQRIATRTRIIVRIA
jgi:hypothetical protein